MLLAGARTLALQFRVVGLRFRKTTAGLLFLGVKNRVFTEEYCWSVDGKRTPMPPAIKLGVRSALYDSPAKIEHSPANSNFLKIGSGTQQSTGGAVYSYKNEVWYACIIFTGHLRYGRTRSILRTLPPFRPFIFFS